MTYEEIFNQVKSLYPDLSVIESEAECQDRYCRHQPDDNQVFLASNYLIRSFFVKQPINPTKAQEKQLNDFHADLKYFKNELIKRLERGRFALMLMGHVFVFEMDCSEDPLDDRLNVFCVPVVAPGQPRSMPSLTCWEILGIPAGSSLTQVKAAYQEKAKIYHPDKPTGDKEAFIKLSKAFEEAVKQC